MHRRRGRCLAPLLAVLVAIVGGAGLVPPAAAAPDWHATAKVPSPRANDLWGVSFHPSDRTALIVGAGGLILRYEGGLLTVVREGGSTLYEDVAWAPDGHAALVAGGDGSVLRFANGTFDQLAPPVRLPLLRVRWTSPSDAIFAGGRVAIGGNPGESVLLAYNDTTRSFRRSPSGGLATQLYDAAPFPDGGGTAGVAVGLGYAAVRWDAAGTSDLRFERAVFATVLRAVDWSHLGEAIAVGDQATILAVPPGGNGTGRVVVSGPGAAFANNLIDVRWSRVQRLGLITGDSGTLMTYDGSDSYGLRAIRTQTKAALHRAAWRADGAQALVVGKGGTVLTYPGRERVDAPVETLTPVALVVMAGSLVTVGVLMLVAFIRVRAAASRTRVAGRGPARRHDLRRAAASRMHRGRGDDE